MTGRRALGLLALSAVGALAAARFGFASRAAFVAGVALAVVASGMRYARVRRPIALLSGVLAAAGVGYLVTELHERLRGERPFPGTLAPVGLREVPNPPPPPPPGRPLVFVAWGDARGGASVFERVCDAIRTERPAFSIGLGDLIGMARPYQFEILRDELAATGVPAFVVPGNHDLDPYGSLGPYESVFGPSDWRFDVGDVSFFAVNSALGPVSEASARLFREAATAASGRGQRVVLFTHHPPFPPNGKPRKCMPQDDPNVQALQATLEAVHATTFSGDWHAHDVRTVGRVTQHVSGGAGSKLEYDGLHHYLRVTVTPTSIDVEKVDLPPRHESPTFADRWTTFREEAAYVARTDPVRMFTILFAGALALGALGSIVVPRRTDRSGAGAGSDARDAKGRGDPTAAP